MHMNLQTLAPFLLCQSTPVLWQLQSVVFQKRAPWASCKGYLVVIKRRNEEEMIALRDIEGHLEPITVLSNVGSVMYNAS